MVTVSRGTRVAVAGVAMEVPTHKGWAVLTPVSRPELGVRLEMSTGVTRSGGGAKWSALDRPGRQDSQEYKGVELERQSFSVLFEGEVPYAGAEPASVQPQIAALKALRLPLPGEYAPPILNVDGPLEGRRGAKQWQLESAVPQGEEYRREEEGYIWQAEYDLVLALYVPITTVRFQPPPSPAAAAAAAQAASPAAAPATSGRTYTVRAGDNLTRIAQSQLGSGNRWREIATLNNLTNPNLIRIGQVLKLP